METHKRRIIPEKDNKWTYRSSTAVILRVKPENTHLLSSCKESQDKFNFNDFKQTKEGVTSNITSLIKKYCSQEWVNMGVLETLLVKRAFQEGDRFSGHICFPGGKRENKETDYETAARECWEEVGINLCDTSKYIKLGQIDDACIGGEPPLVVTTFVFLQLHYDSPPFSLQHTEIFDVAWVPIAPLLLTKGSSLSFNPNKLTLGYYINTHSMLYWLMKSTGVEYVRWPVLDLREYWISAVGQDQLEKKRRVSRRRKSKVKDFEYALWGLSLCSILKVFAFAGFIPSIGYNNTIDNIIYTTTSTRESIDITTLCKKIHDFVIIPQGDGTFVIPGGRLLFRRIWKMYVHYYGLESEDRHSINVKMRKILLIILCSASVGTGYMWVNKARM